MSELNSIPMPEGPFLLRPSPPAMVRLALGSACTIATLLCIPDGFATVPNAANFGVWLVRMVGLWLSGFFLWTFGFLGILYFMRFVSNGIVLNETGFKLWRFGKVVPWKSIRAITCEPQPFFSKAFCLKPLVHRLTIYCEKPGKQPKIAPYSIPSFQFAPAEFQSLLIFISEKCFSIQPSGAELLIAEESIRESLKLSYERGRTTRIVMSLIILLGLVFFLGRRSVVNYSFNMGNHEYRQEHYDAAAAHFRRASFFDPTFAPAWDRLARSEYRSHNIKDAEQHWAKALEMKPDFVEAKIGLATIAIRQRDYSKARQLLKKAIMLSKTNVAAYMNLADLYIREYQYSSAIEILNQVVMHDEVNGRARGLLARAYLRSGKIDEASKQLKIRDHQHDNGLSDKAFVQLVEAELLLAQGHLDQAQSALATLTASFRKEPVPDDLLLDWITLRSAQSNAVELNKLVADATTRGIPVDEIESARK